MGIDMPIDNRVIIMKVTVDRIEKCFAVVVLEDETLANLPLILLPEGAKEGSVISIECDAEQTKTDENRIKSKLNKLFNKQ